MRDNKRKLKNSRRPAAVSSSGGMQILKSGICAYYISEDKRNIRCVLRKPKQFTDRPTVRDSLRQITSPQLMCFSAKPKPRDVLLIGTRSDHSTALRVATNKPIRARGRGVSKTCVAEVHRGVGREFTCAIKVCIPINIISVFFYLALAMISVQVNIHPFVIACSYSLIPEFT